MRRFICKGFLLGTCIVGLGACNVFTNNTIVPPLYRYQSYTHKSPPKEEAKIVKSTPIEAPQPTHIIHTAPPMAMGLPIPPNPDVTPVIVEEESPMVEDMSQPEDMGSNAPVSLNAQRQYISTTQPKPMPIPAPATTYNDISQQMPPAPRYDYDYERRTAPQPMSIQNGSISPVVDTSY